MAVFLDIRMQFGTLFILPRGMVFFYLLSFFPGVEVFPDLARRPSFFGAMQQRCSSLCDFSFFIATFGREEVQLFSGRRSVRVPPPIFHLRPIPMLMVPHS